MTTRKELTEALRARYRSSPLGKRIKILDEFVALTGYHRKHAIRVLGEEAAGVKATPARNRLYGEAVRQHSFVQLQKMQLTQAIVNAYQCKTELFRNVVAAFVAGFIPSKEHLKPQFCAVVNE
jgi:hypothetical protein